MNLEQKHLMDKNKYAMICHFLVNGAAILVSLVGLTEGITIPKIIRLIIFLIVAIIIIPAYLSLRGKETFKHACALTITVTYGVALCTTDNFAMYAMMYPIALLLMIYSEKLLTTAGSCIAIFFLVICFIRQYLAGAMTLSQIFTSSLFALAAIIIAGFVSTVQNRHSEENVEEIKVGTDAQLETSRNIVELAEALNVKFNNAKEVSDTLNERVEMSHSSVGEIAESTRINAESIERQTSKTMDIQTSIQAVEEEAKNMAEISVRTNGTVDEGVVLIEQLKAQATEVAKINTETNQTTQDLNESIKDVQAITETILGISSQTNLLALNASIEAARAGEAGKGFAVVADEIRNLSEDTRKATEQISEIIARLTKDAENASAAMLQSAEYADKQNELIVETGSKLTEIQAETDSLQQVVVQVNDSVASILSASSEIMDSITSLSATGEEIAASTDTVLSVSDASMDALTDMNKVLEEISRISTQMEEVAKQ